MEIFQQKISGKQFDLISATKYFGKKQISCCFGKKKKLKYMHVLSRLIYGYFILLKYLSCCVLNVLIAYALKICDGNLLLFYINYC